MAQVSAAKAALLLSLLLPTAASAAGPLRDEAACSPQPKRLIILGDSIVDCYGVGGPDAETCGPKAFHTWLQANYARTVTYENLSVSGATTSSVARRQLPTVPTGPGHALVVIFVGGNDLYPYLYAPENVAQAAWPGLEEELTGYWEEIFAFFEDPARFPDGAEVIVNTQYNPFDDCYGTSQGKIDVLHAYNDMLFGFSEATTSRFTADPYSPFLGHGHNYQRRGCPYYDRDADYWMGDIIHPNDLGHAALADIWADLMMPRYDGCF